MISSGERSMPPSIGLKISAVICGRSAVVRPVAFASSIGSFFLQLVRERTAHAPRQLPTRARRRISPLAGSNAFTEPLVIRFSSTLWQEDFGCKRFRSPPQLLGSRNSLGQSDSGLRRWSRKMFRAKSRKSPTQSAQSFSIVCAPSMR